jgi:GTP pyrophosphokinase
MYPYRIQKVKWSESPSSGNFQTGLRVIAALEPSVINEIMDIVNSFRASLRMFNVTENDRQGTYDIAMKIAVPSNLELDKVTSQIRNLRNVIKISRM